MNKPSHAIAKFKRCPLCQTWFSDVDILFEGTIVPIGMLILPESPEVGVFFFHHKHQDCCTTFAVNSEKLAHFIDEPIPPDIEALKEGCNGHCVDICDRRECPMTCKWAPYRRLLTEMLEVRDIRNVHTEDIVMYD